MNAAAAVVPCEDLTEDSAEMIEHIRAPQLQDEPRAPPQQEAQDQPPPKQQRVQRILKANCTM